MIGLETWRKAMRMHPWHFWGLVGTGLQVTSSCIDVIAPRAWQHTDRLGREDIRDTIEEAEQAIYREAHFWPSPRWTTERIEWPGDRTVVRWSSMAGANGMFRPAITETKHLIALGPRKTTSLGFSLVTLIDLDGDGINERFNAYVLTPAVADEANLVCTPSPSNWALVPGETFDTFRIEPLAFDYDGSGYQISGPAWLLADKTKQNALPFEGMDVATVGALIDTVWLSEVKTDQAGETIQDAQVVLNSEGRPYSGCPGCTIGNDPATSAQAVGRGGIRNARNGIVTPAESVYDSVTGLWRVTSSDCWREPDSMDVRLYSGVDSVDAALVVCRLAAAMLTRNICACEVANREISHWQEDLAETGGNTGFAVSPDDLNNPFGTRRGQIAAWKWLVANRILRAQLV